MERKIEEHENLENEKYSGFTPDEIESLHDSGIAEEFEEAGTRRDSPYQT